MCIRDSPTRVLQTPPPQNLPVQADTEDSDTQEEDVPDIWSDELFPLNIIPFSDDDNDNDDPDYQATEEEDSTSSSSENEEEDNMANVGQQANAALAPAVSGGQLSSVSPFMGNQGLDGLVYVEAIDRARYGTIWVVPNSNSSSCSHPRRKRSRQLDQRREGSRSEFYGMVTRPSGKP